MAGRKGKKKESHISFEPIYGDLICSFLFVLASSLLGEIAGQLDLRFPDLGGEFAISIVLLLLFLLAFSPICALFSGAIFNPVNSFALATSGKGKITSHVLRMAAQLVGALGGSYAATRLIPEVYQSKFHNNAGALKEGVQLEQGFMCEVALGFMASLLFLFSLDMKNRQVAFWLPLAATAAWCYLGSFVTGPSMNPSMAFSWNWHYGKHTLKEHLVVFWAGPFFGAGLAGLGYLWLKAAASGTGKKAARKGTRSSPRTKATAQAETSYKNGIGNGASNGVAAKEVANGAVGGSPAGVRRRAAAGTEAEVATPPSAQKRASKKVSATS